jgi:hypothetical protein
MRETMAGFMAAFIFVPPLSWRSERSSNRCPACVGYVTNFDSPSRDTLSPGHGSEIAPRGT